MPFLDVRTIFVICAFFMFFYGFGMIAFARKMSGSFNGIYLLAWVNFLIATGISLLLFRGYIDIAWSIIVGSGLLILACNLIYHAHLQFIGYKKQPIFLSAVLLIGIIILLLIFTYIIPNTNNRVVILSSFYSLQFFVIAQTIRRFQQQTEQTSYTPLIIIAAVFAVFFVFRLVITLFSEQVDPYKLMYKPVQALATIFLMLYIVVLDFFVVLIASGQLVQKVAELAYKDSLTTLYNRRGLDHTMQNNAIFDKPLAVIVCDIDHFKSINDHYGHHVGDIALQAFAKLIKESTRKTDICTRWGGEEFLIILPLTTEQLTFPEYPELRFTNSLGICSKKDSHSFDALIHDADHALYQAKTQGRNRVCIFNEERP